MEMHTDLAMEVKEKFEEDNVEISGVELTKEHYDEDKIEVTTVRILDENGAKKMGRPIGTYVTIESPYLEYDDMIKNETIMCVKNEIESILPNNCEKGIFIAGLGNREVTPDMLGPLVVDKLSVTRHIFSELGEKVFDSCVPLIVSAISPGVMSQTGIEAADILSGVLSKEEVDCMIVIDALAARSVSRLNTTIQITNTGICPGSGVGNHRRGIDEESMKVPVIAIGVPTVVDANTIIADSINKYMSDKLTKQETNYLIGELVIPDAVNMMVTPKNIDESVRNMAQVLSDALNMIISKNKSN